MTQLPLTLEADPGPPPGPEQFLELFGHDERAVLRFTFDAMEWAEDEIEAAKGRHPTAAPALDRAFCVLHPRPQLFMGKAEYTARAHMAEILDRVAAGDDLEPGTATEVCLALGQIALAAPLRARHQKAFEIAFVDAFGKEQATALLGEEIVRRAEIDRDQDLIQEVIDEVRHGIRDEERGRAWKEAADGS